MESVRTRVQFPPSPLGHSVGKRNGFFYLKNTIFIFRKNTNAQTFTSLRIRGGEYNEEIVYKFILNILPAFITILILKSSSNTVISAPFPGII